MTAPSLVDKIYPSDEMIKDSFKVISHHLLNEQKSEQICFNENSDLCMDVGKERTNINVISSSDDIQCLEAESPLGPDNLPQAVSPKFCKSIHAKQFPTNLLVTLTASKTAGTVGESPVSPAEPVNIASLQSPLKIAGTEPRIVFSDLVARVEPPNYPKPETSVPMPSSLNTAEAVPLREEIRLSPIQRTTGRRMRDNSEPKESRSSQVTNKQAEPPV